MGAVGLGGRYVLVCCGEGVLRLNKHLAPSLGDNISAFEVSSLAGCTLQQSGESVLLSEIMTFGIVLEEKKFKHWSCGNGTTRILG